jgi:4-amino-4-deoxy-L-arabinose transferase-like glycosyltransferase
MSTARADDHGPSLAWQSVGAHKIDAKQAILLLIAVGSLLRIFFAASVGLGVDESYMVGVSRQFALSYFDHPPLHVWLVGSWAALFGENPVVVRLPFIALFAGSTWLMFRLTAFAYGERAGFWAALAFNLAPAFTLSTGSWVLPDGPMVFFLLLGAYFSARILLPDQPPRNATLLWLAAGVAGGLAMLSKYLAVFLFVGIGLSLLTSREQRHWLARPAPWLAVAVALLLFTPVLAWNATHGFASFAFQGQRGIPSGFNVNWFLQSIGGQFLYLLPWMAVPLGIALFRNIGGTSKAGTFFVWLAVPAISMFFLLSLVTRILPHWPMVGWLFAFPPFGAALAEFKGDRARQLQRWSVTTAAILIGFLALAATQASTGWVNRVAPGVLRKDPTLDLFDWKALGPTLVARGLVPAGGFVATDHWIEAGKVNYALGGRIPVLCLSSDPRSFAFLYDERNYRGKDAVLVARSTYSLKVMATHFARIEMQPDIVLMRDGQPAVTLKVARAFALKTSP